MQNLQRLPKPILILFIGYGVNFFGSGLTLPFLMVYLHTVRHFSMSGAGTIVSLASLTGFLTAPMAGWVIDRLGSFQSLLSALIVVAIGTELYAVAFHYPIAIAAAILTGIGNSMMWNALSSRLAVLAGATLRSRVFGLSYAVQNLGLGIGGGIAGLMVHGQSPTAYLLIFILDGLTYVLFVPFVFATKQRDELVMEHGGEETTSGSLDDGENERTNQAQATASTPLRKRSKPVGYRQVIRNSSILSIMLLNLLYVVFGFSQLNSAFTTWTTTGAGAGASIAGVAFFANCIIIAIVQLPVLRWTEGWRRTRLAMTCGILFAVCWGMTVVAGVNHGLWTSVWLIAALAVFGIGETFLSPSLSPLVNDLAPNELRGRYNAFYNLSWQAGTAVGPFVAGLAFDHGADLHWFMFLGFMCLVASMGTLFIERIVPSQVNINGMK